MLISFNYSRISFQVPIDETKSQKCVYNINFSDETYLYIGTSDIHI